MNCVYVYLRCYEACYISATCCYIAHVGKKVVCVTKKTRLCYVGHRDILGCLLFLIAGVRLNTDAAKRFVRNALWEAEEQQGGAGEDCGKDRTTDDPDNSQASGSRKRKLDETSNSGSVKRTRV